MLKQHINHDIPEIEPSRIKVSDDIYHDICSTIINTGFCITFGNMDQPGTISPNVACLLEELPENKMFLNQFIMYEM